MTTNKDTTSSLSTGREAAQGLLFPGEVAERIGQRQSYRTGARLFTAGSRVSGLHLIVSGSVRILRGSDGRALVVHRESVGGLLGEVALFGSGHYPATAIAAEPTVVVLLPAAALRAEMRRSPDLAAYLMARLARRAESLIARLDQQAHQTVVQRLAAHVVMRHAAVARSRNAAVSLGMTQAELAEELATVKEVVVRALGTLRRLGLIEPAGRGLYRMTDVVGLRRLAQS
jgi:CRP/FNR family transcriptional regulator